VRLLQGGLCVQTRSHGGSRAFFYACSSYYHRGRSVCENGQALPMERINWEVPDAFRTDLLNPAVLERALAKLEARLIGVDRYQCGGPPGDRTETP